MLDPCVNTHLGVEHGAHNIQASKMITDVDVLVDYILIFRENEACLSLGQEVYLSDIITLKVHILILWTQRWLQEGTDPGDESGGSTSEYMDLSVCLLVDVQTNLKSELVWELIHKDVYIVLIFTEIVLHCFP
jgi:hypothetical protein